MNNTTFDTILGAIVILIAVGFFGYTYVATDSGPTRGYELTAKFNRIDGVTTGTDVRLSGIKIGTVAAEELDPVTYMAVVRMTIQQGIELPDDSSVKIASEGLLGGNYLSIEPGGSIDMLEDGDEILFTQGSVDLMGLIGQAIFAVGGKSSDQGQQ